MSVDAVSVFISYSHKDEAMRLELDPFLKPLIRQGLIIVWHDRKIPVGVEWDKEIDGKLQSADIILMLMSQDFLSSDYINDQEVPSAVRRHLAGDAKVIPVILRAFDWESSPVTALQSVPRDKKAVTNWPNRDDAYLEIITEIRQAAGVMLAKRKAHAKQREDAADRYRQKVKEVLADRDISIVERRTLNELQAALKHALSAAEAKAIEDEEHTPHREYAEKIENYKLSLLEVIQHEYPIGPKLLKDLEHRKRDLGLQDEDAAAAEAPILAQAERDHQALLEAKAAGLQTATRVQAEQEAKRHAEAETQARVAEEAQRKADEEDRRQAEEEGRRRAEEEVQRHAAAEALSRQQALQTTEQAQADSGAAWARIWQRNLAAFLTQFKRERELRHLFVDPDLPKKTLAAAVSKCKFPAGEPVVGLVDTAWFGAKKAGLIFGLKAVYFTGSGLGPGDHRAAYESLVHVELKSDGADFHLKLGDGVALCIGPEIPVTGIMTALIKRLGDLKNYHERSVLQYPGHLGENDVAIVAARIFEGFAADELLNSQSEEAWDQVWTMSLQATLSRCASEKLASDTTLHVAPDIPEKKLANAMKCCEVPEWEIVLGLIDSTVFGSAKNGLVFCSYSMYFCNSWSASTSGVHETSYEDLLPRDKVGPAPSMSEIELESGVFFEYVGIDEEQASTLFGRIRTLRDCYEDVRQKHQGRLTAGDVDDTLALIIEEGSAKAP